MTLQARQGGNLPFNFGGMTKKKVNAASFQGTLLALTGFRCRFQDIGIVLAVKGLVQSNPSPCTNLPIERCRMFALSCMVKLVSRGKRLAKVN